MPPPTATTEYDNTDTDIETGQEEEAVIAPLSFIDTTPNQVNKHHEWLVIGTTVLILIIGFTTLSLKYTPSNKSVIQKQTRNLIDVSSWASILGSTPSPTKSPTQKPIIDMSDWHDALGLTPPVSYCLCISYVHHEKCVLFLHVYDLCISYIHSL